MDLVVLAGHLSHFPSQTRETTEILDFLRFLVGVSPRFGGGPERQAQNWVKLLGRSPNNLLSESGWFAISHGC